MRIWTAAFMLLIATATASAARLEKSYSYFTISGKTFDEIEEQLAARGPTLRKSGRRHPGATDMEFNSHVGYVSRNGGCYIGKAAVTLKIIVTLPKLRDSGTPGAVRLVWDALAADIARHEEAHVRIAQRYAIRIEQALRKLPRSSDCDEAQAKAKRTVDRVLADHDEEQTRFDEKEAREFESRLQRLVDKKLAVKAQKRR